MAGNLYEQGYYETGSASVTQGQTVVTGQGTAWLQIVRPADDFGKHVGMPIPIASVDSDTQITLAYPWPGPTQATAPYRITFTPYHVAYRQALQEIGQLLESGNVSALADLVGDANKLPMFNGPGSMGLISKQDLINGVRFDVQVDELAGRDAYDNETTGFTVLVADVGDGRSAIYTKNSASAADWSDPAYITGPVGPLPAVGVGTVSNLPPGSTATVTDTPIPGGVDLNFGIPEGRGAKYSGAYDAGTTYELDDAVLYNGSTWIALQETTGNAPPVLPTTSNAYWSLLARQGTDGAGTGDVVGPASATDNHIVLFNGTTGKLIKDGGKSIGELATTAMLSNVGIGGDAPSSTPDAAPLGAFSTFSGTEDESTAANFPPLGGPGSTARFWDVITYGVSSRVKQVATEVFGIGSWGGRTFIRVKHDSTWSSWQELITTANAGILSGFRNKIINGDLTGTIPGFPINQRNHATPLTPGIGVYGYDRWRGHADGLEQVCEGLEAGEYTLRWTGGGNGRLGGGALLPSPIKATVSAGNVSVVVPTSAGRVSLVEGDAAMENDPFSPRPEPIEEILCRWFFRRDLVSIGGNAYSAGGIIASSLTFGVPMRATPAISKGTVGASNVSGIEVVDASRYGLKVYGFTSGASLNAFVADQEVFSDAEIH